MKAALALARLFVLANLGLCSAVLAQGQEPSQQPEATSVPGTGAQQAGQRGRGGDREARAHPVFGRISAISGESIEVTEPDGNKVTLQLTASTEYRKDRQGAKLTDFKVGDAVVVRTDQADGRGKTALMVASGQFGMRNGQGGPGGGGAGAMAGTLGKDFVIGEVKAVDPPRLTLMRIDNVSQTLELNEETSLRRGRESVTMAEIQAGDHVVARGTVENDVFVPQSLHVIAPEQWKRMQEMMANGLLPALNAPAPKAPSTPRNPAGPQN